MITIPQNKFKQKGWYFPFCGKIRTFVISFDDSFKYKGKNQSDLHKVFGIGIFSLFGSFKKGKNKKWWEVHKWLSLRLGARWNDIDNKVEVTDYSYVYGVGERDTTNNKILQLSASDDESKRDNLLCRISIEKGGMRLMATNLNNMQSINVFIPCKIPFLYLCLVLRAYMENVFRTGDVNIHTH